MKRSLGRIALALLLIVGSLDAAQYVWSVLRAPDSLHVGESAIVRYQCRFDGSAGDYTVQFKPRNAQQYKASMVTQSDHVKDTKRILQFDVLITPSVAGVLDIKLDALVRHTTFGSIEDASIGRDNVRKYDFKDETVPMPSVKINVMENTADLSGEIALIVQVDKSKVRSHEPVHLSLYVRGHGNLNEFIPYELNLSGVKHFSEPPSSELSLGENGYEGEIRQEFALVAEKSYMIPSFSLSVFDTKKRITTILRSSPIAIEVEKGYISANLLDPPALGGYGNWKNYGVYTLFVLLGAVGAQAIRWLWAHRPRRKYTAFWDKAVTANELSVLLSLRGNPHYAPIIKRLDEATITVAEAKKNLHAIMSTSEGKQ